MTDTLTTVLALALVAFPVLNAYFVVDGYRLYRMDPERSPILLALLWVKALVWVVGLLFSLFSVRYLLDLQPVFPLNGLALAVALTIINLMPFGIHLVMERYERR